MLSKMFIQHLTLLNLHRFKHYYFFIKLAIDFFLSLQIIIVTLVYYLRSLFRKLLSSNMFEIFLIYQISSSIKIGSIILFRLF